MENISNDQKDPLSGDSAMTSEQMVKYMNEFDIKDMPSDFEYSPAQENKLAYNMLNGYKLKFAQDLKEDSKVIMSKLEESSRR